MKTPTKADAGGQLAEEVFVGLMRTADALARQAEELLRPYGLSPAQYNVLRILRGAGPEGLACGEIGGRMISRDPDITRLLDRLEARALIGRVRGEADRRVVRTSITAAGLDLLREIDGPLRAFHRERLRRIGAKELRALAELLQRTREGITGKG